MRCFRSTGRSSRRCADRAGALRHRADPAITSASTTISPSSPSSLSRRNILNSMIVALTTVLLSLALAVARRLCARPRHVSRPRRDPVRCSRRLHVSAGRRAIRHVRGDPRARPLQQAARPVVLDLIMTLPFTVWILTAFMARPAARHRGSGDRRWRLAVVTLIWRVLLPLMAPAIVATGLLAFIVAWNEFLFALTFTCRARPAPCPWPSR